MPWEKSSYYKSLLWGHWPIIEFASLETSLKGRVIFNIFNILAGNFNNFNSYIWAVQF